jgi:hypothetical protein
VLPRLPLRRALPVSVARSREPGAVTMLIRLDRLFQSLAWLTISALSGLIMLKMGWEFLFSFEARFNIERTLLRHSLSCT